MENDWNKDIKFHAIVLLFLGVIVFCVFSPYGIKVNGTMEEYSWMRRASFGLDLNFHDSLRPFAVVSIMPGVFLTPNSFLGLNLLNTIWIVLKGFFVYLIGRKLKLGLGLALSLGILVMLFPHNQNLIRLIAVQWVTMLFFVSIYLMLLLQDKFTLIRFLLMYLTLVFVYLSYEAAFIVATIVPFLLWWRSRRLDRQFFLLSSVWYFLPLILGIRLIFSYMNSDDVYLRNMVGNSSMIGIVSHGLSSYWDTLVGAWINSLAAFYNSSLSNIAIAIVVSLVVGFLVYYGFKQDEAQSTVARYDMWLFGWAFLSILVGYFIYMVTSAWHFTDRAYASSAFGAILVILILIHFFAHRFITQRYSHRIVSICIAFLTMLVVVQAMFIREREVKLAFYQQRFFSNVLELIPDFEPDYVPKVVIFDETGQLIRRFGISQIINNGLSIIYDRLEIQTAVCYPNQSIAWFKEYCTLSQEGLTIETSNGTVVYPFDESIFLILREDDSLELLTVIPPPYSDTIGIDLQLENIGICHNCSYPDAVDSFFTEFPFDGYAHEDPVFKDYLHSIIGN